MANAVVTVLEADGSTQTDVTVLDVGRQAAAASKSVALATEDKAVLDNLTTIAGAVRAEDVASADGHAGIVAMAVRKGTPANTSGTDGDYEMLQISAGRLWTSAALEAGTNAIGKLAANSGVDIGDVDVTSVVPGTTATSLGKAEDAAHSSGDTGVMALAVRKDSAASFAGTDGDYAPLQLDANGALRVTGSSGATEYTEDAAAASDPVGSMMMAVRRDTLSASEVSADGDNVALKATSKGELNTHDAALLAAITDGDVAHDAADSGNPAKIGAKAIAGLSGATLVAAADRTNLYAGLDGALINRPHCGLEDIVSGVASNTDGASTEVIAAAAAGIKQYLTSATIINTSASMVYVELKSGTTVKWRLPVPATSGVIFNPPVPLPPNAAAEAWNFDSSAAATTLYYNAIGFKSKV